VTLFWADVQFSACEVNELKPILTENGIFCPYPDILHETGQRAIYCVVHATEALYAKE
jgi:hypothetical protein